MNFLKPSSEKLKKKRLYGFDIETYGNKNKFLMGSIVGEKEKFVFWDLDKMRDFILNSHKIRNSYMFATNLGFDFLGLFGDDFELLTQFNYVIRGSDFIIIRMKQGKNNIYFLDTMSYLKAGVKAIGKIININKLDKPDCLGKFVLKDSADGRILEDYNIQDSLITYKFAEFLQDSFSLIGSNLKWTIASTSMSLFRNKYLKYWIKQPSKPIIEDMFKGYYGGRVEAFYRGKIENLWYYDINSLYPYVMSTKMYPLTNSLKFTTESNINLIEQYEGMSYCKIETPNYLMYPLLPYRYDNKLMFPLGKFDGWYTHIELRKAIQLGHVIEPVKTYYCKTKFNPFKEFVTDIYKKRMENIDSKIQIAYKILLNSLYGKFAQRLEYGEIFLVNDQKSKDKINKLVDENIKRLKAGDDLRYKIDSPDLRMFKDKQGNNIQEPRIYYVTDTDTIDYPKFINPLISAYVTAYARLELYKWIEKIQNLNGNVYYVDTDSVICNKKLETSTELGDMKLESEIKEGYIVKPKFYYVKGYDGKKMLKAKGLHNLKDFDKLLETKKHKYMKFTKFKESIRRNLNFNEKLIVEKIIDLSDNKRVWEHNEFSTKRLERSFPFYLV